MFGEDPTWVTETIGGFGTYDISNAFSIVPDTLRKERRIIYIFFSFLHILIYSKL
ncbi:hypothetical protein [Clostridium puniceum]|uniref:hypothetical protein n=1 Tax=Clostridium puniceum TaxID=29367 RepID=UPI001300CBB4|nr:hypothetical protein [Clostridium puniceum]